MSLGQFFFEGEAPERNFFVEQGVKFGFDLDAYLEALDQVPSFTPEKVEYILAYNKSLARFIMDLAEGALSRKKAKKQLWEQNEVMQAVLEHTHMMAVYLDRRFNFVWVNQAYAKTCKHDQSFFPGKNHFDLYPHPENQAIFQRVIETGEPFFVEAKAFTFPDQPERGVTYWDWSLAPTKDNSGKINGLVFTLLEVTERILSEKRSQKSEKNFRTLIENVIDWVWVVDKDGTYTYVSPQAKDLIGYEINEILGRTPFDFMSQTEAARVAPIFFKAVNNREKIIALEDSLLAKDGSEVVFETNAAPIYNTENAFIGYMGTCRDITLRKHAEKERRLNEIRLEALMQLNESGPTDPDELSRFALEKSALLTDSNIGFINFLSDDEKHITHSVYTKNTLAHCRPPKEIQAFEIAKCELLSETLRKRQPIIVNENPEERAAAAGFSSGLPLVRRFISIPVFEEDRMAAIAALGNKEQPYTREDVRQFRLFMDGLWRILQRKRIENTLKISEMRFRELAELLPETIYETDLEGNLTFVNPQAFQMFGYTQQDFDSGLNAFQMIIEEDLARAKENYWKIIQGETVEVTEYTGRKKDGTTFPALFRSSSIQRNSEIVGLRGFIIDITQKQQMQAQLEHSRKMQAIGALAGGVAHEFNNMLTIIMGNAELAAEDIPGCNAAAEQLKEIQKASLRAKEVVQRLLNVARKSHSARKPTRIAEILYESLDLLQRTIPSTVSIRQKISCTAETILADSTEIHQVVLNLCTNAQHALHEETGVINVSLEPITLDQAMGTQFNRLEPGPYAKLIISDTGEGIHPDIMERVFEPYYTTKEIDKGLGMGLAVVDGIIKKHEGAIHIKSEVGKGTTVEVFFPLIETQADIKTAQKKTLPASTERVLLIDDEPSILKMLTQMINRYGYEVTGSSASVEALELFRRQPHGFDLVITDMSLPHMPGDRLAREMMRIRPDIPVILCTGHNERMNEKKALNLGIKAFITKPFLKNNIVQTIQDVLKNA